MDTYTNIYAYFGFIVVYFGYTIYSAVDLVIYYDAHWKPVPLVSVGDGETLLKTHILRYGFLPCSCANSSCGCCVNMRLFSFNRTGCMNFIFDPLEFSIGVNMLMDGNSIYENKVSAKNPPPACLEAPQVMYLPPLQFCIKLYDIYLPENRLHMCVNLETRLARAPLLVLQFDCFLMGRGGVSNVKPEASNMFYTLVVDGDNRTYLLTNDTRISNRSDESSQYIINSTESLNSYVAT
ncbi:uncharacterized protein isoform X1 [Rhodnius prolixus]|uniref:uncharacterized protein isoform X1 n=1 Tax=Rhodnius prolixus TaxID=13249 RepID=UPI003D18C6C2